MLREAPVAIFRTEDAGEARFLTGEDSLVAIGGVVERRGGEASLRMAAAQPVVARDGLATRARGSAVEWHGGRAPRRQTPWLKRSTSKHYGYVVPREV